MVGAAPVLGYRRVALGLIIGGAIGNAIDRLTFGAVADFVLVHITTPTWRFDWYVFNLAEPRLWPGSSGSYATHWPAPGMPQKRPDFSGL